jgi:hypothetical protein
MKRTRTRLTPGQIVGLSVSYERDNLLARGLGLEHLRELIIRLARPLVRSGANLAYGGHWRVSEDNFTYDLLGLISGEQEDTSAASPDGTTLRIGQLYNHLAWPGYLSVTPRMEAEWINSCRIIRITQQDAGIAGEDQVEDADAMSGSDTATLNAAITLSAMRRRAVEGGLLASPAVATTETIGPMKARIAFGGKLQGYSGFLPGIFEEALVCLEHKTPLYILGGFGGAAEALAQAFGAGGGTTAATKPSALPQCFTAQWHCRMTPKVDRLVQLGAARALPRGMRTTQDALNALWTLIWPAEPRSLSAKLNTGLDDAKTLQLMTTRDMALAVRLVHEGLQLQIGKLELIA